MGTLLTKAVCSHVTHETYLRKKSNQLHIIHNYLTISFTVPGHKHLPINKVDMFNEQLI